MLGYFTSDKYEINVENYKIQSFNILHKTDLNIHIVKYNRVLYSKNIINNACKYGHEKVLEWFKNSGYEFKYDVDAINFAASNGNVNVLEWFKNSGYEFKYDEVAIYYASSYGYIDILEWFKNSDYEFKYDTRAIDYASKNGQIQVLEWFINSGYKLKYNIYVLKTRYIKILKFYSNHINIKKLIKFKTYNMFIKTANIFIKTIKFKTHNRYIKGYQKN
jgi:hypothetical protein